LINNTPWTTRYTDDTGHIISPTATELPIGVTAGHCWAFLQRNSGRQVLSG
jgi:hypothetical protein